MEKDNKYFFIEQELREGDHPINEYFDLEDDATCLDGWFTLDELKRITNAMEILITKKNEDKTKKAIGG